MERAADLFAERGIAGTSVDEVLAAGRGAGKGQFYHYFRGRDELAAAAVGYRCAQVVAGLTNALGVMCRRWPGWSRRWRASSAGSSRRGCRAARSGRWRPRSPAATRPARLQAAAGFDAWERLLADALERMRERGELRADAEPVVLATGLLASIEGGMVLSQARQDMASLHVAVEAGLAQVRTCLS